MYLLFGIPGNGSDVEWFAKEGDSLGNGTHQRNPGKRKMGKAKRRQIRAGGREQISVDNGAEHAGNAAFREE